MTAALLYSSRQHATHAAPGYKVPLNTSPHPQLVRLRWRTAEFCSATGRSSNRSSGHFVSGIHKSPHPPGWACRSEPWATAHDFPALQTTRIIESFTRRRPPAAALHVRYTGPCIAPRALPPVHCPCALPLCRRMYLRPLRLRRIMGTRSRPGIAPGACGQAQRARGRRRPARLARRDRRGMATVPGYPAHGPARILEQARAIRLIRRLSQGASTDNPPGTGCETLKTSRLIDLIRHSPV